MEQGTAKANLSLVDYVKGMIMMYQPPTSRPGTPPVFPPVIPPSPGQLILTWFHLEDIIELRQDCLIMICTWPICACFYVFFISAIPLIGIWNFKIFKSLVWDIFGIIVITTTLNMMWGAKQKVKALASPYWHNDTIDRKIGTKIQQLI